VQYFAQIRGVYDDVTAADVYDVLHDPRYRKTWDPNIAAGREICRINQGSEIGYYASWPIFLSIYQNNSSFSSFF